MKNRVFLTALFLVVFFGTTAHALNCTQKINKEFDPRDNYDDCVDYGKEKCLSTSVEDIKKICGDVIGVADAHREESWRDVTVDRVAIEQRVLKQIRERAEKTKVRNNRTYY